MTGGNGSSAGVRLGLGPFSNISNDGLYDHKSAKQSLKDMMNREGALTGLRYRKLSNLSMADVYPIAGLHFSYGFRSWKGKMPKSGFSAPGLAGRLNLNEVAPLMPIRATHSNLSPMMTVGYEKKLAKFTQIGFETGMITESGSNRMNVLPGEHRERWTSTGAIAQMAFKTRFF